MKFKFFVYLFAFLSCISASQAVEESLISDNRLYLPFPNPFTLAGFETFITGVREVKKANNEIYLSGIYDHGSGSSALIYQGNLFGAGSWHVFDFPSSQGRKVKKTSFYGPNSLKNGNIQAVGSYTVAHSQEDAFGCLYEGSLNGDGNWTTLFPETLIGPESHIDGVIAHSTMGGYVVGNYFVNKNSRAFIYEIASQNYFEINNVERSFVFITGYGIWHNSGNSYTICGSLVEKDNTKLEKSYLVDWNRKTKKLSNWRFYYFNNNPEESLITHFDGITGDGKGGYYLTGEWQGKDGLFEGLFAHVQKKKTTWSPIKFPVKKAITFGTTVYKQAVFGVYKTKEMTQPYVSIPIVNLKQ